MTNQEEFENKCMDIIEVIVSIDVKQNRQGAIAVAKKMLDSASKKTTNKNVIAIYERVVHEFEIATDEELRKLTKIQTLTQRLDREVKYYNEHQNSLYQDAKIRSQNTIIALCNELMQNGEIIKDKNLKTFQAIIIERNGGRKI